MDISIHTIDPELRKMLQPGRKVRVFYNDINPNNEIRHIRAIVDEDRVVYKVWQRNRYRYYVRWVYDFELDYKKGYLTKA